MWRYVIGVFLLLIIALGHLQAQQNENKKQDPVISVIPLTKNVYQHISYLQTQDFGLVDCNGIIYINGNEAIICDTPADENQSRQLLQWMKAHYPAVKIKAVVVNHFHADCLAGLSVFHEAGATSYAHQLTPELLRSRQEKAEPPKQLIATSAELSVGKGKIVVQHFGEAHTRDNIVTWIPSEQVVFGGCVIKALNAGKGNLADANVKEWSNTVGRIKNSFSTAKIVVPGHGKPGGIDLLDFTIKMFEEDRAK
jgi:metallo-beta-lactamase class B